MLQIVKLMECVDSKKDPLIQILRTYGNKTNSSISQTAWNLKKNNYRKEQDK